MRIACILPSLEAGGAERVASELSLQLSKDHEVFLILNSAATISYPYGGEKIELYLPAQSNIIKKIVIFFARLRKLRTYKKYLKIDISLSFMRGSNVLNLLSRIRDHVYLSVHTYESGGLHGLYGFIYRYLMKFLYRKADGVIAVSRMIAEDLVCNFNVPEKKIRVIHNPVNIEAITKLVKEDIASYEEAYFSRPSIVVVGRLNRIKAQWNIIRALVEIRKRVPDCRIVFIGKGELEEYLKDLAESCGVGESVHFLGYKKNPFAYLNRASAFVLCSSREGFPNVIVEAMACGVPVISTDCKSGPREICAPESSGNALSVEYAEYGILVPPCEDRIPKANEPLSPCERSLAEATCELLQNHSLSERYRKAGQSRAKDFDYPIIMKQYRDVLSLN
ncbi:MAG TPA: glycosyltransferase [Spirochaetia bacterium]|nr:glycosyltransferase [Spirochaetia bacterium]